MVATFGYTEATHDSEVVNAKILKIAQKPLKDVSRGPLDTATAPDSL
jgi:hypothetical protein